MKTNNLRPWQPGVSGNPNGRPKGSRNIKKVIQDMLDDPTVYERLPKELSRGAETPLEAIICILMVKAMRGDIRATDVLLKYSVDDEIHLKKNQAYVLKGTLLCVGCNKRLYASAPRTGNGGHSPRYHCSKGCKLPSIPAKVVHEEFKDMLKKIKPTEGTLRLYKEVLIREANNQLGRINGDIKNVRAELDDIARLRVSAIEKFTAGDITKQDKDELIDSLEARKLDANDRLKDLETEQAFREVDIEHAINFMECVDMQWADVEFELQQRFQNMLFPNGIVYDSKNHRFGTSKISPLYQPLSREKYQDIILVFLKLTWLRT